MSWILLGNPSATRAGLDEVKLDRMFMEVFLAWPKKNCFIDGQEHFANALILMLFCVTSRRIHSF